MLPGLRTIYALLAVCAFSVDPEEHATRKRPALFTISGETTVIDGPLTQYGTIDYIAYLNARHSEGVTADNNAAVLLCEAFGPEIEEAWDREAAFAMLKIPIPPEDGEYLVNLDDYARRKFGDDAKAMIDQMLDESGVARNVPWTSDEFPELAALLDANERALDLVMQASRRERCYMPFTSSIGNHLYFVVQPIQHGMIDASRLLGLRSTRHLGEGDVDAAWEDLMCILRLATLLDDSGSPLCELTAMAAHSVAFQNLRALLNSGLLSETQSEQFLEEYIGWKSIRPPSETWIEMTRISYLNCLQEYAAGNLSMQEIRQERPLHGTSYEATVRAQSLLGKRVEFVMRVFGNLHTDWDAAARRVNYFFDGCREAFATTPYRDRELALKDMEKEFVELAPHYYYGNTVVYWIRRYIYLQRTRLARGHDIAGMMVEPGHLPWTYMLTAQTRFESQQRLMTVALALAAYRARYEEYPSELAELVPDYLGDLPLDPYSDGPLIYRRNGVGFLLYAVGPNLVDDGGVDINENDDDFDLLLRVDHAE
jgi:hypothetical protein